MKTKSVLIVEDDIRVANILATTISKEPEFDVVGIANSAVEAKSLLDCFEAELVFLDVSLDDSSGLDVLRYIRQQLANANISVVMLTASKDAQVIQEAMSYGAFDYILKPLVFSRLKQTLTNYCDYRTQFDADKKFEQSDLDALFHHGARHERVTSDPSMAPNQLPKGIDSLTLEKVHQVFKEHQGVPFTAELMSEKVGVSRSTARRYLEHLLNDNQVVADIEYGTVGRPERHYILQIS